MPSVWGWQRRPARGASGAAYRERPPQDAVGGAAGRWPCHHAEVTISPTLALLHSPLVGASTMAPLGEVLRARGHRVEVPSLEGVFDVEDPGRADVVDRFVARLSHVAGPVVMVAHSAAGPLLAEVSGQVAGVVAEIYIDAFVGIPGVSSVDQAPRELVVQLQGLVREGRLPPWDTWFPGAELPDLGELPRVPWTWFTESPRSDLWNGPWGYLRLTGAYPAAVARAESLNAPIVRLDLDHLAPMTDPEPVADALEELLGALL